MCMVYEHTYMCIHMCVHVCVYSVYECVHVHVCMHEYMCKYLYMYVCGESEKIWTGQAQISIMAMFITKVHRCPT